MKEEIAQILNDNYDTDYENDVYVKTFLEDSAAHQLYKLFLSKHIELLNEIRPFIGVEGIGKINEALSDLNSQLKLLQ